LNKIKDIEVLRAIAVTYTLIAHRYNLFFWEAPYSNVFDHYFSFREGVDVFFVISGFVITKSLYPLLKNDKNRLQIIKQFWIKRIFRLAPSAWFWALITYALGMCTLSQLSAALLNFMNVYEYIHNSATPVSHYWSLSLEEQFYLMIPLIFLLPFTAMKPILLGLCVLQILLHRPVGGSLWFVRSDALLLGVLMALTMEMNWRKKLNPIFLNNKILSWGALIFLLMLLSIAGALNQGRYIWCGQGIVTLIAGCLVWVASFDKSYTMPNGYLKNTLVWVGARSYAIYLVHPLCFTLMPAQWRFYGITPGLHEYLYTGYAIIFVGILSELNYRLIETPIRAFSSGIFIKESHHI